MGRLSVMLLLVLSVSVALGQDNRGSRSSRGRSRGGDRGAANGDSRRVDARTESFLRRIDANHNGMIDADEVAGGYKPIVEGVLSRMGIELKYPIPLSKIAQIVANGNRAESGDADAGAGSSPSENKRSSDDSSGARPANGFAQTKPSQPIVRGFGQPSGQSNDGETKTAGTPESPATAASSSPSGHAKAGDAPSGSASANPDPPPDSTKRSGPKSGRFLTPKERLAKGLPDWFLEKDVDGDGQVTMAEFASRWTQDVVDEFNRYDLNHDGVVTPAECLKVAEGPRRRSKGV